MNTSLYVEAGTTAVTPGTAVPAPVRVRNTGDTTMQVLVRVVGVEDSWTGPPMMVGPLAPGEETTVEFLIRIPVGFPPCDHLAGIEAEPIDPSTGAPVGRPVFVEMVLEIGDGSQVSATLDPTDINGGGRGRFLVQLRNRSRNPIRVQLDGESPGDTLAVRFAEDEVVLPPGEYVSVKGSVRGSRPLVGPYRRLPFVVTIRSRGTPRHLDGSFTQSPTLKSGVMKVFAIVGLIGIWASALVFGLGKINPPHKANSTQAAATQSASDTANTDGGAGGSGGSGGGSGGASGGGASGGAGAGGSTADQAPTGTNEIRVGGKVKASDPSGATVAIQRTSLVDENAQGATFVNGSPSSALTMHYGHTGVTAPSLIAPPRTTTTDADGAWAFAGISAPGFYLITISKPGFATKKFVVAAPEDGSPIVLDSDLVAGDGTLGGTITGPDGNGLGGVDLTITDGTVTLKTITPTTGAVGKWSVTGLTTPGKYLITASRRGFGTETLLADLSAGGSKGDANIAMKAGVGSVSGHVFSLSSPVVPVGGVTVKITDGTNDHTATSLTIGDPGFYTLPQLPLLPVGQFYTLTVSGGGWTTSTQKVDLNDGNDNPTIDVDLTAADGSISGTVFDVPPLPPAAPRAPRELDDVGITISNEKVTLKTTSATGADLSNPGFFLQGSVPPGTYKVTFEKFGFVTQSAIVTVVAGVPEIQNMSMPTAPPESLDLTGSVSISVIDQKCGTSLSLNTSTTVSTTTTTTAPSSSAAPPSLCAVTPPSPFAVEVSYVDEHGQTHSSNDVDHLTGVAPGVVNGVAVFKGVTPGLHTFHATADHHKPTDVVVQVFPHLPTSGTAVLLQNAIVTGLLLDVSGHPITDAGMQVLAIPPTSRPDLRRVTVNVGPDGRYIFDGSLDEATWALVASGSDFVTNDGLAGRSPTVPVTVAAARTIEQPITLHRKGRIQAAVRTLDESGATQYLTGATVGISGGPTGGVPNQTVGSSDLTFSSLTAGTYSVTVTNGGEVRSLASAVVVDDSTTLASVTYGSLQVKVQTVDGGAVPINGPDAVVTLKDASNTVVVRTAQNVAGGGTAFFGALRPGSYQVTVSNKVGDPVTFSQTFAVSISDNNVTRIARVLGRLEVAVQAPDVHTGLLDNSAGVVVTLKRAGVTQKTTTSTSDGPVVFSGLDTTIYSVEIAGVATPLTATISNGAVTRVGSVIAAAPTAHLTGHVVWNVNGTTQNVPSAVVSVTGITGYTFSATPTAPFFSFTVTTGTQSATFDAHGLFDVDTTGFKFLTGNITVSATNFVTRPVGGVADAQLTNADLSGPIAAAACPSAITALDANAASLGTSCIVLAPNPGTLNGTISLVGAHGDTPNAVVTAQITQPLATGITVSVASDGHLVVNDPTVSGTNAIRPGDFQITFTATGYDKSPVGAQSFTINPNAGTTVNATLTKRATLPINVFCRATAPALPTEATATVVLTQGATTIATTTGASPITFPNLLAGTYNADVTAPGCAESTTNSFILAAGDNTAQTVQLTKLAKITGTIVSQLIETPSSGATPPQTGVSGLTVTVTGQTHGQTATAQTQTDGSFTFGNVIGLVDDTYVLAINPFPTDGYTLSTSNPTIPHVTVAGHIDAVAPPVVLIAKKATMHGKLRANSSTGAGIPGVQITATTSQIPPSGKTLTVTTDANGDYAFDDGTVTGHTSELEPVLWNFNYSITDFNTLGESLTLTPGSDLAHDVVLAEQKGSVTGKAFTKFGSAPAAAEGGVTVSAQKNGSSANPVFTTTSSAVAGHVGEYAIPGLVNGQYTVTFHKDGFTNTTTPASINNGNVAFNIDGTINVNTVATTVDVHSAAANANPPGASVPVPVGGATVTLTPQAGQRSPDTYTATTDSNGHADFSSTVLPSAYTISISFAGSAGTDPGFTDTDLKHKTTLDSSSTTLNVAVAAASAAGHVQVQEARVMGKVFLQDNGTPPGTSTSNLTVRMFNGTDTSGTPAKTFTTVADGTVNGISVNWAAYVDPPTLPSGSPGYTFVFSNPNYKTVTSALVNPFTATDKSLNLGSISLKHLTTLAITVTDKNGAAANDATVELLNDANTSISFPMTSSSGNVYTFSNLDPTIKYRIRATRTDADTFSAPGGVPPTTVVVHHVEGKVVTNITLTPGTATRSVAMTEPQTAIDEP